MEWQSLITGIFVALASLIVARRLFAILSSKAGSSCSACGGCSGKAKSQSAPALVQLGSLQGTVGEKQ